MTLNHGRRAKRIADAARCVMRWSVKLECRARLTHSLRYTFSGALFATCFSNGPPNAESGSYSSTGPP